MSKTDTASTFLLNAANAKFTYSGFVIGSSMSKTVFLQNIYKLYDEVIKFCKEQVDYIIKYLEKNSPATITAMDAKNSITSAAKKYAKEVQSVIKKSISIDQRSIEYQQKYQTRIGQIKDIITDLFYSMVYIYIDLSIKPNPNYGFERKHTHDDIINSNFFKSFRDENYFSFNEED